MQSKRELELEVLVWQARTQSVQNGVAALNAQAMNFAREAKECETELARAQAAYKACVDAEAPPAPTLAIVPGAAQGSN